MSLLIAFIAILSLMALLFTLLNATPRSGDTSKSNGPALLLESETRYSYIVTGYQPGSVLSLWLVLVLIFIGFRELTKSTSITDSEGSAVPVQTNPPLNLDPPTRPHSNSIAKVQPETLTKSPPKAMTPSESVGPNLEAPHAGAEPQAFQDLLPRLRKNTFVLIYDTKDLNFKLDGNFSPLKSSLSNWKRWLRAHKMTFDHCLWKNLYQCRAKNRIYVILPGVWNDRTIKALLDHGEKVILFGMPFQIYSKKHSMLIQNITFERQSFNGDTFTMSTHPGSSNLSVPRLHKSFRANSLVAMAVAPGPSKVARMSPLGIIQNRKPTGGRGLWTDIMMTSSKNSITASIHIFQYLLNIGEGP